MSKVHTFFRMCEHGVEQKRMRVSQARREPGWYSDRNMAIRAALKEGLAEMNVSRAVWRDGASWDAHGHDFGWLGGLRRTISRLFGGKYGFGLKV
jgi:hypothetical protein